MAANFLSALFATLIMGAIARVAANFFTTGRGASVAVFSVALGYALGRYSYSGPATSEAVEPLIAATGSIVALLILWAWLLRKAGDAPTRSTD
jgi:hypothetical protein